MKIRSLTLKNIGVFEDETISFPEKQDKDLAEIHILTGQNGTGKTTILQALAGGVSFSTMGGIDISEIYLHDTKSTNNFSKKFINKDSTTTISFENNYEFSFNYHPLSPWNVPKNEHFQNTRAFAYSGYRFIEHQEYINVKENLKYYPLLNALEFVKEYGENDYTLNQWLANNISKRSFARDEGNEEKAKVFDRNIKLLEQVIQEIIEKPIKFEPVYETGIKIVANIEGKKLDFDLLPDGLRSIISWLGDLIMRMDALKWKDDLPIFEREFILFLDEIEVHLHPSWQRKILPVVQKLFKNAQIFITTHSPFIVNSVDGAWIHKIELTDRGAKIHPATVSENGNSISYVLRETFGIKEEFGLEVNNDLEKFYQFRDKLLAGNLNGSEYKFIELSKSLAVQSLELNTIIQFELRQINKVLNTNYSL
ncbi:MULTISPECIES: AAA family ATPase [Emticicia]|uniref:AAA family ATPase n=1 Tax=Emticicia TaxID=312278 RepID=UPI0007D8ABBB|nr:MULTISPECIES: ATP-binding protein [Emticicia]